MAELDLDALEQAAREAGGGCWFSAGWTVGSRGFEVGDLKSRDRICSDATERCAEFIAAANPATILELLSRLKAAEKERDALRAEIEELHVLIAAVKKQANAEFRLRVKKEEEYARLRAKIEGGSTTVIVSKFPVNPTDTPLYALPGAQTQGEEE